MSETRATANPLIENLYQYRPLRSQWWHTDHQLYRLFNASLPPQEAIWRENFTCPSEPSCGFGHHCSFPRCAQRDYSFNRDALHRPQCDSEASLTLAVGTRRTARPSDCEGDLSSADYNAIWQECAPCEPGPYKLFVDGDVAVKKSKPRHYDKTPHEYGHLHNVRFGDRLCRHYSKPRAFHQQDCRERAVAHSFAQYLTPYESAAMVDYFTYWRRQAKPDTPLLPQLPLRTFSLKDIPLSCPGCGRRDTLQVSTILPHPQSGHFPQCVTLCSLCNLQHSQSIYK